MVTLFIAIYGAILSTLIFLYSLYRDSDKINITYGRCYPDEGSYWVFTIINQSSRSLFLKSFMFRDKEGNAYGMIHSKEYDGIDTDKTVILEPNRSIEIWYDQQLIAFKTVAPSSFFAEEENGKRHFMRKSLWKK